LILENAIIAAGSEMDHIEDRKIHQDFMKVAIEESKLGTREGGIPIGSLLVRDGKIIGQGHNRLVQERDPTSHAEIDCLRKRGRIGSYNGTTLYSTLMPCYLCAGAVVQFGIKKVVVEESETFRGGEELMVSRGVQVINLNLDECKEIMKQFIEKNQEVWNEDIGKL
jgi:creatinine deaminase